MAGEKVKVKINHTTITLTNTKKVLYPGIEAIKAEVVQYALSISDFILPLIKNRPLTTIRWPDGIQGKMFYSKNKPSWTPQWMQTYMPGDGDDNQYLLITDQASLAWVANLAALELHPMNMRIDNGNPDQMIFDLDPSEDFGFEELKKLTLDLKEFLVDKGYHPFVKTSGGKGFHIYLPVIPQYTFESLVDQSKKLAQEFIAEFPKIGTLRIGKEKRKDKVLIDIYRNHRHNSCVAPFSLRGKPGAPVSTPFPWNWIDKISSSQEWNIRNIHSFLEEAGNAWEKFNEQATSLIPQSDTAIETEYIKKRDFEKTSEPHPGITIHTTGDQYVIQLHNASNLHYDLRLERDGTLWSWAIPKGIPIETGVKRLAIRTEDHPLKYLTFEGKIPKGQYGGGEMWIYDEGRYSETSWSDKKIKFSLSGGMIKGDFILYNTNEDQWLMERKDNSSFKGVRKTPMLASSSKTIPSDECYFHEIKWDGIRALFILKDAKMTILSRNGNDISNQFPEITEQAKSIEAEEAILDGEIVFLDDEGKPDFSKVVGRIHLESSVSISRAAKSRSATVYFFDLLQLDGRDCTSLPCVKRREWLRVILTVNERLRFSDTFSDGHALFSAITEQGMEGIISKNKNAPYFPGVRSDHWLKIKVRNEDEAYVIGWTKGQGDRAGYFGAIHLAKKSDTGWRYMGKIGTGFDTELLKSITRQLKELKTISKPITEAIEEPSRSTWVEPAYMVSLEYASLSSNGTYREPVFKGISDLRS